MSSKSQNKQNAAGWRELDYHQRARRLRFWRARLGWGIFLICLCAVLGGLLTPRAKPLYQSAPVSPAHAMFANNCAACHRGRFRTAQRMLSRTTTVRTVPDHVCSQCHEAVPHHGSKQGHVGCAVCHREHQGKPTLASVDDQHCTRCHAVLNHPRFQPQPSGFLNVTGFPHRHPEMALWRKSQPDPGQLHFNHKTHLSLSLRCSECHQMDSSGEYAVPVSYKQHCAKCHPLSVQLVGEFDDPKLTEAVKKFNAIPAPHADPAVIRAVMRERLLRFVQQHPVLQKTETVERLLPGPPRPPQPTEEQWAWADRQLTEQEKHLFVESQLPVAERLLFLRPAGCRYCHVPEKGQEVPEDVTALPRFRPTNVPDRWLTHAKFRHRSHRAWRCSACHSVKENQRTSEVMMPGIKNCASCHNSQMGAPSGCVTCHDYHGSHP